MSKLAMQPSFRAGCRLKSHAMLEKPKNKRQMYGSQSSQA